MSEIIYRTIAEDDIPAVNEFYNGYHRAGRTTGQFRWEFLEGPHGKGIYCLAEVAETGRIIGIQAGIPIRCTTAGNEEILTVKSEDTLIDVDLCARLKQKNLFRDLYAYFAAQCAEHGAECIWGFTWAKNSLKRIGFQLPFDTGQGLLVLHPFKSYRHLSGLNDRNSLTDKVKIAVLAATSFINGWRSRYGSRLKELTVSEGIQSNEEIVHSLAAAERDLVFMKQDPEFLAWRLNANPYALSYKVLNFQLHGQVAGQIITSLHPNGQGYLEQLLLVPGLQAGIRKKILRTGVQQLCRDGAIHIRVLTFPGNKANLEQVNLLKSIGFIHLKKGMAFIFKPLKDPSRVRSDQFFLSRLFTQGHN